MIYRDFEFLLIHWGIITHPSKLAEKLSHLCFPWSDFFPEKGKVSENVVFLVRPRGEDGGGVGGGYHLSMTKLIFQHFGPIFSIEN